MEPGSPAPSLHCVLLPCRNGETWALPLNSIAELVTAAELSAGRLCWRGLELPVYPLPTAADPAGGLYAVITGLQDLAGGYWAISLQDRGLKHRVLTADDLAEPDPDDSAASAALAVFALAGDRCVVPDLGVLQVSLAADPAHSGG